MSYAADGDDWITTISGKQIKFSKPDESQIDIEDIATGLSNLCRYAGQIRQFYSVAQHSVLVCDLVWKMTQDSEIALSGLVHDSTEAYMVDVPAPLKNMPQMTGYRDLEDNMEAAIYKALHVPFPGIVVKLADKMAYRIERAAIFHDKTEFDTRSKVMEYHFRDGLWEPFLARQRFLDTYRMLKQ